MHLGKYFPPAAGGIERFLSQLVSWQSRSGLESTVLVHHKPHTPDTQDTLPIRRVRAFGELLFVPISPQWPVAFARTLREVRPDLLHIHMPNPWAFCALFSAAARSLPWVVHWHADVPHDHPSWRMRLAYRPYAQFEQQLLRRAATIVVSSQTYLDASATLSAHRDRCAVIPLGLEAERPESAPPDWPNHDQLKLLAVGRLSYYKGFETLLDAVARTADVQLLLIGEGERRTALAARIAALGLHERVRMTGHLDDPQIEAAYRACDVFCLPSLDRAEAFGLVLLEAMRAGKPVVASAVPGSGMTEVVQDQQTGLLVSPGDPDSLAEALALLRERPDLRAQLGQAGRGRFEANYRFDPVGQSISDVYGQLLASSGRV
nr:glycosyltransferase [Pseudomarimonas arenosa]